MKHGHVWSKTSFWFRKVHTLVSSNQEKKNLSCTRKAHISRIWDSEFLVIFGLLGKTRKCRILTKNGIFASWWGKKSDKTQKFSGFEKKASSKSWNEKINFWNAHIWHTIRIWNFAFFTKKWWNFRKFQYFVGSRSMMNARHIFHNHFIAPKWVEFVIPTLFFPNGVYIWVTSP